MSWGQRSEHVENPQSGCEEGVGPFVLFLLPSDVYTIRQFGAGHVFGPKFRVVGDV